MNNIPVPEKNKYWENEVDEKNVKALVEKFMQGMAFDINKNINYHIRVLVNQLRNILCLE